MTFERLLRFAPIVMMLPISGCNALGHIQAGPVVAASTVDSTDDTERTTSFAPGGELNGTLDLDMAAASEWLSSKPQPDHANRLGPTAGVYVRGTSDGMGVGAREGFFVAGTNTDWMGRLGGTLDLGVASLDGKPYGAVGLNASVTGGFTVSKSYDDKAWFLCRSLTYLTFTLVGSYQRLPDGPEEGVDVWSTGLLVGITALSDGGAPSDAANAPTRCPR